MEIGEPCAEEAVAACVCVACEVSILSPANLALSGSGWLDTPFILAVAVGNALPCNLSGLGLGVGRILGVVPAP